MIENTGIQQSSEKKTFVYEPCVLNSRNISVSCFKSVYAIWEINNLLKSVKKKKLVNPLCKWQFSKATNLIRQSVIGHIYFVIKWRNSDKLHVTSYAKSEHDT